VQNSKNKKKGEENRRDVRGSSHGWKDRAKLECNLTRKRAGARACEPTMWAGHASPEKTEHRSRRQNWQHKELQRGIIGTKHSGGGGGILRTAETNKPRRWRRSGEGGRQPSKPGRSPPDKKKGGEGTELHGVGRQERRKMWMTTQQPARCAERAGRRPNLEKKKPGKRKIKQN